MLKTIQRVLRVTPAMHMTEAPVGTCDECGMPGGHIVGCTVAVVAQNMGRIYTPGAKAAIYVPTGAEFDATQVAVALDADAPAKVLRVYDLAQELGRSSQDVREAIAHLTGVPPMSSSAKVRPEVAVLVRDFVASL